MYVYPNLCAIKIDILGPHFALPALMHCRIINIVN